MKSPQEKSNIVHIDDIDDVKPGEKVGGISLAAYEGRGILKSRFDELSIPATVWVFRKTCLFCFLAYTLNMIDAWQVRLVNVRAC